MSGNKNIEIEYAVEPVGGSFDLSGSYGAKVEAFNDLSESVEPKFGELVNGSELNSSGIYDILNRFVYNTKYAGVKLVDGIIDGSCAFFKMCTDVDASIFIDPNNSALSYNKEEFEQVIGDTINDLIGEYGSYTRENADDFIYTIVQTLKELAEDEDLLF